jgi:hypothetical protein
MVDIDPGLDTRLRAFFDHYEGEAMPPRLATFDETDIDVGVSDRGRRPLFNLFAGLAAAAVVAAAIALFAIELTSHENPATGPAARSASPTASPLNAMPVLGDSGVPTAAHVVISLTRGHGPVQLQTFVPQGTLYIQFDSAGPGVFKISSTDLVVGNDLAHASNSFGVTTLTMDRPQSYDRKPLTLRVTADPSTRWEVFVAESRAPLPVFIAHADSRVLVPVTYGTGLATLPAFMLAPGEGVHVQVACNSATKADTVQVGQNQRFGSEIAGCSTPSGGHGEWFATDQGGPNGDSVTSYITADPAVSWEILITDGPPPILAPPGGRALQPSAYGRGSDSVPVFTAATTYTIAIDCSGAGSLTMSSSLSQVATILCAQYAQFYFTPSDQVPGQPVSLSVVAPPGVGWEVEVFDDGGPAPGTCATLRDGGDLQPTPCVASSS